MIRVKELRVIILACILFFAGCSNDNEYAFQQNDPDPSVRLFEVLDETPALKSLFTGLDQHEFNVKLSRLMNEDPRLFAELMRRMAEMFYGYNAPFPQAVSDMSDSFSVFHDVYCVQPDALDRTVEMVKNILSVDSNVMMEGADSINDILIALRNLEQDEHGVFYSPHPWNLFGVNQELADIGYDGVDNLIENIGVVHDMYNGAANLSEPDVLLREFVDSLLQGDVDIETRVADMIDSLKNTDDVSLTEREVADWMVANPMKSSITQYMMSDLYPMLKDPDLVNVNGESNVIIRGKQLLDEEARILSATPNSLSGGIAGNNILMTKWLMQGIYNDMRKYDNLEQVEIFDVENNDMLKWADTMVHNFNAGLKLSGSSDGISKNRVKDILWDGWIFDPYGNGSRTFNFKGVLFINNNDPAVPDQADGYVAKMAKTRSLDSTQKTFRLQINDILNGDNDGDFFDDNNDVFKLINYSYTGESQIESIMTNLQLYLLSYYYSPVYRKWAWTPEDGDEFFGDNRRNIKDLYGGLSSSLRNLVVLDKNGMSPAEGGRNMTLAAELVYVLAAGYGITDPVNAPGELSLENCLRSMGSPLATSDSISVDTGLFTIHMNVLGNNRIYRKPSNQAGYVSFTTQSAMPAMEILQPGMFRYRTGGRGSENVGGWQGKFSPSQGDIRGIVNDNGHIVTSNWTLTEIALSCWEGYGPFTFKGRAPNGSDCKYRNHWTSDWYYISGRYKGNKGPGFARHGFTEGRYRIYESIMQPEPGQAGFVNSGYYDSTGNPMPRYGYMRENAEDGSYVDVETSVDNRLLLDCKSREEAIRKNFQWLMNQKKYQFLIPIQSDYNMLWGSVKIEIYAFTTINANGIVGVTKARRYNSNLQNNARWGESGIQSNYYQHYEGESNYFVNTINEGKNTCRFSGVSFDDSDYMMALDYKYYIDGWLSGIAKAMVDMTDEIWGCLGDNPVLPPSVGENFNAVASLGDVVYDAKDIMYNTGDANMHDVGKFKKYYDTCYADAALFDSSGNLVVREDELPPVPWVKGVHYPVQFDNNGFATGWEEHTGDSKGKFEDMLGILACAVGTIHEDGTVYADIHGNSVASYDEINRGDIGYFEKDGYRANIDNLILMVAALNEHKKDPNSNQPVYNTGAWINKLVDHDPVADQTTPGSRAGVLPSALSSKYMNFNHMDPVKDGLEDVIRHTFRMYLNNFMLTQGYDGDHGSQSPSQWQNLPAYYLHDSDGNRVDYDDDGYFDLNPDINWNIPINRLRYFADDRSLDQLRRTLDLVKDCSQDERFVTFLERTIINMDKYLIVKYLDQHPDVTTPADALMDGVFQVFVPRDEWGNPIQPDALSDPDLVQYNQLKMAKISTSMDDIIEFLKELKYDELFDFIQEFRLNDIEKWYNFSFDDWGDTLSPALLQQHGDEMNARLLKYFGMNLKEGLVNGIYILDDPGCLPDYLSQHFVSGEKIWGLGKYQKITEDEMYLYDNNDIIEDINGDSTSYYVYIDLQQYITDFPTCFTRKFEGITAFFDFKKNMDNTEEFEEYCMDYRDKWYRGGKVECPNIYSGHNYDLRMDWAMDNYNQFFFNLTASDFSVNQPLTAEGNPSTMLDWLFGWDGSSDAGIDLKKELNVVKNDIIKGVYDTEVTVIDPDNPYGDRITDSLRNVIRTYRESVNENVFEYQYGKDSNGNPLFEEYFMDDAADLNDGHRHMMNNIADIVAALLNPDSNYYKTGRLFAAWQNFVEAADIPPEDLLAVRDLVGNLLYDKSTATYTDLFTKLSRHMPSVLEGYQGRYDEILELAVTAMQPDGIGTYMLTTMEVDSAYDSWQMVDEYNYLLHLDIFQNYESDETFWWQMGNLMQDFAILMDESNGNEEYELYGSVKEIFE